ncbi:amidohydrolase family protein [Spirosoma areae]
MEILCLLCYGLTTLHLGTQTYDTLMRNSRVVDSLGNPWFYADVATKNGEIAFKRLITFTILLIFACGCSPKFYTQKDFRATKKIDAHMHIRTTSQAVSEQALADYFKMVTVNVGVNPAFLDLQESISIYQVNAHPKQIHYLTAFTLDGWNSDQWAEKTIRQLKESFNKGALGVKLWKNIGMTEKDSTGAFIMVDDPRFDPVIQFIIAQNKIVMGHLGEPKNCWLPLSEMTVNNDREYFKNNPEFHMYLHPEYPSYTDQIQARDRFVARHPTMRFIGSHLGSLEYDVDSLALRLDRFPNMAVDMAERISHLQYQSTRNRERVRKFMIKYQDRILYGTDLGMRDLALFKSTRLSGLVEEAKARLHRHWVDDWQYFTSDDVMEVDEVDGNFNGLKLPKSVIDKIYYTNAVKWLGIKE